MIDFHMHFLPGMDDGSKDVETSLRMLQMSDQQGIDVIAATSHFYARQNSPEEFLARRRNAAKELAQFIRGRQDVPYLLLGAEVHYFRGMSKTEDLEKLCLQGTDLLLLEMPFVEWSERMLLDVEDIRRRGLRPVAAHIERYFDLQPKKIMDDFLSMGFLIQCNAEFFLNRRTSRRALQMLKNKEIQFLGSDAHNVDSRSPDLGEAVELIRTRLGEDALDQVYAYEREILEKNEA